MTIMIPSFTLKGAGLYAITGLLTAVLTFGLAWVILPSPAPTPVVPVGCDAARGRRRVRARPGSECQTEDPPGRPR